MADEEMAEEYEENAEYIEVDDYGRKVYGSIDIEDAFLAGLKAGKPKWHKVKSGDLPPEDTKVLAFMAGGEVCIAHFYRKNVWDKIGIVIAWCEIPKYTEE